MFLFAEILIYLFFILLKLSFYSAHVLSFIRGCDFPFFTRDQIFSNEVFIHRHTPINRGQFQFFPGHKLPKMFNAMVFIFYLVVCSTGNRRLHGHLLSIPTGLLCPIWQPHLQSGVVCFHKSRFLI